MVLQLSRHGHVDAHRIYDPSESVAVCLENPSFPAAFVKDVCSCAESLAIRHVRHCANLTTVFLGLKASDSACKH